MEKPLPHSWCTQCRNGVKMSGAPVSVKGLQHSKEAIAI